jgi:hypothetical protein
VVVHQIAGDGDGDELGHHQPPAPQVAGRHARGVEGRRAGQRPAPGRARRAERRAGQRPHRAGDAEHREGELEVPERARHQQAERRAGVRAAPAAEQEDA